MVAMTPLLRGVLQKAILRLFIVTYFCKFVVNPNIDLESDYITRNL